LYCEGGFLQVPDGQRGSPSQVALGEGLCPCFYARKAEQGELDARGKQKQVCDLSHPRPRDAHDPSGVSPVLNLSGADHAVDVVGKYK
jgi:hypothetical protein